MIKLPINAVWNQNNRSDKFGDIWSSYNLDLTSKAGVVRVSPRMLLNISSAASGSGNDTDLGVPCAFRYFTTSGRTLWAIAGAFVWYSTGGAGTQFVQDALAAGTGTPTNCSSNFSDLEIFNGFLYVSADAQYLHKLSATNTWSRTGNVTLTAASMHDLEYYRAQNRLYFIDNAQTSISSIDTADTPANSGAQYSLPSIVDGVSTTLSCIKSTSSRIWIGTLNLTGDKAKVYAWDGSQGSGVNESYVINANGVVAMIIQDDVPVILDTKGRLLKLNGGTFVELDHLPLENRFLNENFVNTTNRFCHFNGMNLIDGKINILIQSKLLQYNVADTLNKENIPAGIWEYTKETGLYHKASVGQTTSSGTIVDYGQQIIATPGALTEIGIHADNVNGTFLAGCSYYTNAGSSLNGIFYDDGNDTLQKAGYLVTSKIYSPNISDVWQKIYPRFRQLLNSNDRIVVKYRTSEADSTEATITWTSTTIFTTTTDISAYAIGDEIEVLQGVGAGNIAHATVISLNAGTYTVTVNQTFTGATGTAIARFQKWVKIGTCTSQTVDVYSIPLGTRKKSTVWVQFKVHVLFQGKDEINDLIIVNGVHKPA